MGMDAAAVAAVSAVAVAKDPNVSILLARSLAWRRWQRRRLISLACLPSHSSFVLFHEPSPSAPLYFCLSVHIIRLWSPTKPIYYLSHGPSPLELPLPLHLPSFFLPYSLPPSLHFQLPQEHDVATVLLRIFTREYDRIRPRPTDRYLTIFPQ